MAKISKIARNEYRKKKSEKAFRKKEEGQVVPDREGRKVAGGERGCCVA